MPVVTAIEKHALCFATVLLFLVPFSCASAETQTGPVVATIGRETITIFDLDKAIQAVPLPHRYEYRSEQTLNDLVQSMVDWKLMAQEAVKLGLDREAEVKTRLEMVKGRPSSQADQILANAYINIQQEQLEGIPDAEIKKYYDRHREEFIIPERVKIERVIYASQESAQSARGALKAGMSFEELMKQHPAFRQKINSLWLHKSGSDTEMEKVAFSLATGEVSNAFPTPAGYCLLRVEEKKPSAIRVYEEVQAGIKARLEGEEKAALLEQLKSDLRKNTAITINQPVLKAYLLKQQSPKVSPH